MVTDSFFDKQTDLTAAKIKIFQDYIEGYLIKLLMTFENCIIADLFCGAGRNGDKDGSPLVLIDRSKYILTSKQLKNKNPKIRIIFNDQSEDCIEDLSKELSNIELEDKIIIDQITNRKFDIILTELLDKLKEITTPKFFFLDPYTYSNVKMEDLKNLMELPYTEVLLFLPIFHSYRFASDIKMPEYHKTRIFVEEFTTKGVSDYLDIHDFMSSVKEKLLNDLELKYVRPVLLDAGGCKNSLFLLTKHQTGMSLMNKIALKMTDDGSTVKINVKEKDKYVQSLFGLEFSPKFDNFKSKLIDTMTDLKEMTNEEVVEFARQEGYTPKYVKPIMSELFDNSMIKVYDSDGNEVKSKTKWNIAEKISKVVIFKWEGK